MPAQQPGKRQPLFQTDLLQPFFVVFGVEQIQEDFAQIAEVFVGRVEPLVDADAHFAGKAVARKYTQFYQGGVNVNLRQPTVKALAELPAKVFVLFEGVEEQIESD